MIQGKERSCVYASAHVRAARTESSHEDVQRSLNLPTTNENIPPLLE